MLLCGPMFNMTHAMLLPPLEIQPHFPEKISWKPNIVAYIVEAGVMAPTWSPHSLTSDATWTPNPH